MNEAFTTKTNAHPCLGAAVLSQRRMLNDRTKTVPVLRGYVHLDEAYSYFRDFVLYCESCYMIFTIDSICITKEELIEAWNHRAEIKKDEKEEAK